MSPSIKAWLERLELSQYADAFEREAIGSEQLQQLSDTDLINIGVSVLGHRLRILESIAELPNANTHRSTATDALKPKTERRQLTVMFCDLVDSTGLAKKLDPEDLREVVRSYQHSAEQVIQRFGGHVAQYLGDGLMVYFGYPEAHEDDAARAVYSALRLPSELAKLNTELKKRFKVELSVRTGISTGDVVVGHIGKASGSEALATGVTPNEAAHLQKLAAINSNVISKKTRDLIGGRFKIKHLTNNDTHHNTPGIDTLNAESLFEVIGITNAESRFSANNTLYSTKMIGRNDQLNKLKLLWSDACKGVSRAVLIDGEAGIGKSRLIQSFVEAIGEIEYHRIVYQCSPYHTDTPLYPAAQQLAYAAKVNAENSEAENLESIEAMLSELLGETKEALSLLAPLLRLNEKDSDNQNTRDMSAEQKRDATMEVFLAMLSSLTESKPVLFILEDAHWIDATTETLINMALQRAANKAVLILLTARPEYDSTWAEQENLHKIRLERLPEGSTKQLVHQLSNRKSIPTTLLQQIINRTDGVPLFVEELTRTLLDSNVLAEQENDYKLQHEINDIHIPATLQDSLMARLDKMDDVKDIAQVAACVGRDFHASDIVEVVESGTQYLNDSITKLEAAQIIHRNLDNSCTFRHALVRDVAYASLPKSKRKSIHKALFEQYTNSGRQSELLAFHASEAGLVEKAMQHWSEAASSAIERAAYSEAIAHINKAIACTHELDNTVTARASELELLVQQGHASTALNGFAHPDTVSINEKARALLDEVKQSPYRYPVLYGHWVINFAAAQHTSALTDAQEMLLEAENGDNRVQRIIAYRALASSQTMMGEFQQADNNLAKVMDLYDAKQDKELAWQINLDPTVPGRIYRALCKTCMGDGESASELTENVERFAIDLGHSHTIIYMLSHMALTSQVGRWENREYYIDSTRKFVEQHDLMAYLGHALGIEAMMLYEKGELDIACNTMKQALEVINKTKTHIYSPLLYANYAANLADLNRMEESSSAANTALTMSIKNQEYWARSEILRLTAYAKHKQLSAKGHHTFDEVESQLQESITLAESQGAHMWALRSSMSLATLHHAGGRSSQAHTSLQARLENHPDSGRTQADWKTATDLLTEIGIQQKL